MNTKRVVLYVNFFPNDTTVINFIINTKGVALLYITLFTNKHVLHILPFIKCYLRKPTSYCFPENP